MDIRGLIDRVAALENVTSALAIAGATLAVLTLVRFVVAKRLAALAARTETAFDDVAAALVSKTRWYFMIALALRAGSAALQLSDDTRGTIRQATVVAVLLQLSVWGSCLIDFWLRQWAARRGDGSGAATLSAIGMLARGALWLLLAVLALSNVLGYDITALLTGLGIGGVAIALAVQNVLGDVFAALSIVLDKPFEVGDTIAVDTFTGTVEHVGLKTTRLRSVGGEQLVFSNADLLKSRVRNLKRMQERRALFTLGVPYDTPPHLVEALPGLLKGCVESVAGTRFERAHFARFAESWLEFEVAYYVTSADYAVFMDAKQAVNLSILRRFAEEGVEFAFPTRVVKQHSIGSLPDGESPSVG